MSLAKLVEGDKFISVEEHEYRGRYVVCNKSLEAGKVILKDSPYATAIFDTMKHLVCDFCLTSSSSPLKLFCEKCKHVWFCSPKCKMHAKAYHQFECGLMGPGAPSLGTTKKQATDLKLLVRVLAKRCLENSKGRTDEFDTARQLVANIDRRSPGALSELNQSAGYIQVVASKSQLLDGLTREDLVQLLGSIQCNNFALKNFGIDKHYFGEGLYLKSSLFNHSCAPNVTIKIRNGTLEFLMLESVEAGTELNISYADPNSPSRRQHLEENYLFLCQCNKCKTENVH